MTKLDLINAINNNTGGSKKDTSLLLDATINAMKLSTPPTALIM